MEIAKDNVVVIEYDLRLEDGSYIKGENGPISMNFVAGYSQVLPALENRLLGLPEGAQKEFVIPAREAFGEHDQNLVRTMSLEDFPAGRDLQPGKWATAVNDESKAQYGYFVAAKTGESITLDYNHPLAGKDLHYRVVVRHVRAASQDELEFLRPCQHGPSAASDE